MMFTFLGIPTEVRLLIYSYIALDTGVVINVTQSHVSDLLAAVALLQTCRKIKQEYAPILYEKVTFLFEPWLGWVVTGGFIRASPIDLNVRPAFLQPELSRMQLNFCDTALWFLAHHQDLSTTTGYELPRDRNLPRWLAKFKSLRHLTIQLTGIHIREMCETTRFLYELKTPAVVQITTETRRDDLTDSYDQSVFDDEFQPKLRRIERVLNEGKPGQQDSSAEAQAGME